MRTKADCSSGGRIVGLVLGRRGVVRTEFGFGAGGRGESRYASAGVGCGSLLWKLTRTCATVGREGTFGSEREGVGRVGEVSCSGVRLPADFLFRFFFSSVMVCQPSESSCSVVFTRNSVFDTGRATCLLVLA